MSRFAGKTITLSEAADACTGTHTYLGCSDFTTVDEAALGPFSSLANPFALRNLPNMAMVLPRMVLDVLGDSIYA